MIESVGRRSLIILCLKQMARFAKRTFGHPHAPPPGAAVSCPGIQGYSQRCSCTKHRPSSAAVFYNVRSNVISEPRQKIRFGQRPLVIDDREVDAVAVATVRIDHVFSEMSLLLGAEAEDGVARFHVLGVGLELDASASKNLERIPELEKLCFRIDV